MFKRFTALLCCMTVAAGMLGGCGSSKTAATEAVTETVAETVSESASGDAVASADEMTTVEDVVSDDMVPITADQLENGVYDISVASSSSMFKITACQLTVSDEGMTAKMTMGGKGYTWLYMGTGEEAAASAEADRITHEEDADGSHTFTVPVEALDQGIDCAAFSTKKEKWYERTLAFLSADLPLEAFRPGVLTTAESLNLADGTYLVDVKLEGGSGKASVESPAELVVSGGTCIARITWSSPNYDYMLVGSEKFEPVNTEGNSVFEIPVSVFNRKMHVIADTTAMSQAHEIEYTLYFDASSIKAATASAPENLGRLSGHMDLQYAKAFTVDYYEDGLALVTIEGTDRFLVADEGARVPEDLPADITVIQKPLKHIYLAASSAMDFFRQLDETGRISALSTDAGDWSFEDVRQALADEEMTYVGKYSAPDYEWLIDDDCDLAIESTMIYHSPEVKEQLERNGIPVMVERSSYETDPFGRMEWIRLYGLLTDRAQEADAFYKAQIEKAEAAKTDDDLGVSVAFFYINSSRQAVVRRPGDYITRLIDMAGGTYCIPASAVAEDSMRSTITLDMESFYAMASDADLLIYNSAIDGEVPDLSAMLGKSALLADFKAVKNGNVYCTTQNLFQQTTAVAQTLEDLHAVISGQGSGDLHFLYPLK